MPKKALNISFLIFGLLFIVFAFIKIFKFSISEDFPWLLSTGEFILKNHQLPKEDPFSWASSGKDLIVYQWLFSLLIASIQRFGGIFSLVKIFFLLSVFIYLLFPMLVLLKKQDKNFKNKNEFCTLFFVSIASFFMASANLSIRPLIFSSVFLLIQSLLIKKSFFQDKKEKDFNTCKTSFRELLNKWKIHNIESFRQIIFKFFFNQNFLFFTLFAFWSNFHLGFVLGLICLLLLLVSEAISYLLLKTDKEKIKDRKKENLINIFYSLSISFLGSLANPYGFKLYEHLWQTSKSSFFKTFINELQPMDFSLLKFKIFALFFVLLLWLVFRNFQENLQNKKISTKRIYELLVLMFFCIATLLCKRFIVWSSLFFVLYLPTLLSEQLKFYAPIQAFIKSFENYKVFYFVTLSIFIFTFLLIPEKHFPFGSCQSVMGVIKNYKQNFQNNKDVIFNDPLIGSCFLLEKIKQKTYADTRFDFFGESFSKEWKAILISSNSPDEFFQLQKINTIIISKDWPLYETLLASKDYNLIFEDEQAAIIRKK